MSTSTDIVNSIFAEKPSHEIVDEIMNALSTKIYGRIEDRKTEVFANQMFNILDQEEE